MTSQIYSYTALEEEFSPHVSTSPTSWICRTVFIGLLFLAMAVSIIALAVMIAKGKPGLGSPTPPTSTAGPSATAGPTVTAGPTSTPPRTKVTPTLPQRSKFGKFRFGAVAGDSETCSTIGTEMLVRGSTIDAAITTMLCMCLLHTEACGIGGGFLATIYDREKKTVTTMDGRSVAPIAAREDMFLNDTNNSSMYGGLAIAVPGEIAGYAALHKRYGRLPWAELFKPVIKLCEDGHIVDKSLSVAVGMLQNNINGTSLGHLLQKADGRNITDGDYIKRPLMAKTFRRIAEGGPGAFYKGSLAEDIVADMRQNGGIITKEDLVKFRPVWKEPVSVTLGNGNYTLYGPPPPSSTAALFYILNVMNGYNLKPTDRNTTDKEILLAHRLIEAMKFGYGKRSYLGDEDFVNVTEWKEKLKSDKFAEETRRKIKDDRVLKFEEYDSSFVLPNDGGTAHLSVYGPDGMVIAITSTINTHFGSLIRGNKTGVVFNNDMDDFSTKALVNHYGVSPSAANYITPGKRPMSSMCPTVAVDNEGEVVAVVGASGGTRIITAIIHTLINTLWLGYNASDSVDQPRYHHQLLPDEVLYEPSLPQDIMTGLTQKGHHTFTVRDYPKEMSVVQFVRRCCQDKTSDKFCLCAVSDMRRGGIPDGY